jgi:hypothetical protein
MRKLLLTIFFISCAGVATPPAFAALPLEDPPYSDNLEKVASIPNSGDKKQDCSNITSENITYIGMVPNKKGECECPKEKPRLAKTHVLESGFINEMTCVSKAEEKSLNNKKKEEDLKEAAKKKEEDLKKAAEQKNKQCTDFATKCTDGLVSNDACNECVCPKGKIKRDDLKKNGNICFTKAEIKGIESKAKENSKSTECQQKGKEAKKNSLGIWVCAETEADKQKREKEKAADKNLKAFYDDVDAARKEYEKTMAALIKEAEEQAKQK